LKPHPAAARGDEIGERAAVEHRAEGTERLAQHAFED
jgi:hypothetical protein